MLSSCRCSRYPIMCRAPGETKWLKDTIRAMDRLNSAIPQADFQEALESSAIALCLVGADGTILRANKAELDLVGYSAEQYVGRHIAEFHVDQDAIKDILARLERGEALVSQPAQLRARDGSIKHVEVTGSGHVKSGKFLHAACFTVDVTERELIRASSATRASELTALYGLAEKLHRADTRRRS